MTFFGTQRKVFISFHQKDRPEVDNFINRWASNGGVFISKALGVSDNDDLIKSTDPEYVMSKIREKYLGDSTVTIVLIGKCTHSRRYVDWEIKASLRQGNFTPNGLLGILLPSCGNSAHLPSRFKDNWQKVESNCYARYRAYPTSDQQLAAWIEDAYNARTARAHLIQNTVDMMKYNGKCLACGITH
jgi:hypothetical protein